MKICIFSDSHGNSSDMLRAIALEAPDMIIHLGDGRSCVEKIKSQFPDITLKAVRGNCDFTSNYPDSEILNINGLNIFMAHGHLYGVKHGMTELCNAAHFSGAALALYGHTHIASHRSFGPIDTLNPGAAGSGSKRSYAVLLIDASGDYNCSFVSL